MPLTTRTTVLFEPAQFKALKRKARAEKTTVGALIRAAVSKQLLMESHDRLRAVERLGAMKVPVGDWEEMEREILKGACADD